MFYAKNWLSFVCLFLFFHLNYKRHYLTGCTEVYKRPQWVTCWWPQVHVSSTEQAKHLLDRKHLEIKFSFHLWQAGHKGLFNYFRNQKYLHELVEITIHLCRICTMNWKGKTSSELNLVLLVAPSLTYWVKTKYLKIAKGSAGRRGTLKIKQQQDFLHWYPCVAANVNRNDFPPRDPRGGQRSG